MASAYGEIQTFSPRNSPVSPVVPNTSHSIPKASPARWGAGDLRARGGPWPRRRRPPRPAGRSWPLSVRRRGPAVLTHRLHGRRGRRPTGTRPPGRQSPRPGGADCRHPMHRRGHDVRASRFVGDDRRPGVTRVGLSGTCRHVHPSCETGRSVVNMTMRAVTTSWSVAAAGYSVICSLTLGKPARRLAFSRPGERAGSGAVPTEEAYRRGPPGRGVGPWSLDARAADL